MYDLWDQILLIRPVNIEISQIWCLDDTKNTNYIINLKVKFDSSRCNPKKNRSEEMNGRENHHHT